LGAHLGSEEFVWIAADYAAPSQRVQFSELVNAFLLSGQSVIMLVDAGMSISAVMAVFMARKAAYCGEELGSHTFGYLQTTWRLAYE
jgi:hypothetical protein